MMRCHSVGITAAAAAGTAAAAALVVAARTAAAALARAARTPAAATVHRAGPLARPRVQFRRNECWDALRGVQFSGRFGTV